MSNKMRHRFHISALTLVLLLTGALGARAQTDLMLSHYFDVPSFYNPAAIGINDNLTIRGLGRMQWVGIDNAPKTFMGTANMPFKFLGKRFGVGLVVEQESEGLYKTLAISAQLGYKFKLLKGEWTVAVQAGYFDEGFDGSKVVLPDNDDYHQSTDEAIPTSDIHGGTLDLGVGVFYTRKNIWGGVSLQHALSPTIKMSGESTSTGGSTNEDGTTAAERNFEFQADRTLYFMAGGNIPIKNTLFEVLPSVMFATDFNFYTGQVTARLRYNKFLTAGVGYRYDDGITAMVAAEYKGIYLGYSYDYSTSAIAKASSGSHEIVVGYNLKLDFSEKNKNRHKNIRIM